MRGDGVRSAEVIYAECYTWTQIDLSTVNNVAGIPPLSSKNYALFRLGAHSNNKRYIQGDSEIASSRSQLVAKIAATRQNPF